MDRERRFANLSAQEIEELVLLEQEFRAKYKKRVILIAYEEQ